MNLDLNKIVFLINNKRIIKERIIKERLLYKKIVNASFYGVINGEILKNSNG
jgi:hypothetical protein